MQFYLTTVAILEEVGLKTFQASQRFFTGVLVHTWPLYIHVINNNLNEIFFNGLCGEQGAQSVDQTLLLGNFSASLGLRTRHYQETSIAS